MNLLFFGPPGVGKGTQSAHLVKKHNMKHISTGDLFRYNIKNKTSLGLEAKGYIDKGHLVPDSVTIGMVEQELKHLDGQNFILDGFPRTVLQVKALDKLLAQHELPLNKVLFLEVPMEKLLSRLTGRRICKKCGAVYHIEAKPNKQEGVCDKCGGEVVQRPDDTEAAISKRFEVYRETTAPVKEYYAGQGLIEEINGLGGEDEVFSRILKALKA